METLAQIVEKGNERAITAVSGRLEDLNFQGWCYLCQCDVGHYANEVACDANTTRALAARLPQGRLVFPMVVRSVPVAMPASA